MNAQALFPVSTYAGTNAMIPRAVNDICGEVCLTIMKHADFCVVPMGDDLKEAVIAIGNALMPAREWRDGRDGERQDYQGEGGTVS